MRGRPVTGPGTQIIAALDTTWQEIRSKHADVPEAVLITGEGGHTLGHWNATRWTTEDGVTLGEVFVSGERLADGAQGVLSTLLHEAAHAMAHVRKIKDTSRGRRYHNKRFVALADEMGLCTTDTAHKTIGFSFTSASDELAASYESLAQLDAAICVTIGGGTDYAEPEPEPETPRKASPLLECGCPRKIRASEKVMDEGPILCGLCEEPFLKVEQA